MAKKSKSSSVRSPNPDFIGAARLRVLHRCGFWIPRQPKLLRVQVESAALSSLAFFAAEVSFLSWYYAQDHHRSISGGQAFGPGPGPGAVPNSASPSPDPSSSPATPEKSKRLAPRHTTTVKSAQKSSGR